MVSLFQCAFAAVKFSDGDIIVLNDTPDPASDEELIALARAYRGMEPR
jgi:hypothetical protein